MVIKLGRFGKFYARSNFPDRRHTQAIVKEIGVTCPSARKVKLSSVRLSWNRIFYDCDRYPDCDFNILGQASRSELVPKCDHYLIEKKIRGGGKQVVCSNGDYEEEKVK